MYPQNKTLLFAQDIKGYWCKEHQKGMPRIQAVISHYRHNHNGKKISDITEFQDSSIDEKSGKKLSTKLQKEKERQAFIAKCFASLRHKGSPPDRVQKFYVCHARKKEEEEWWKEIDKKGREETESKILDHELYKRAKDAGLPKSELDWLKIQLRIVSEDTDED